MLSTHRWWNSPILLRITTLNARCQVELQNDLLRQTHSISIRDLKRLTTYHKLASEIAAMATAEEPDSICNFFYIGTLLTHEKEPAKLALLHRFFTNYPTYKLQSHLSSHEQTALPFKLSDFMHVPDRQTLPSGNWLVVFKSGRTSVRSHTSYKELAQLYRQLLWRDGTTSKKIHWIGSDHSTQTKETKQPSQGSRKRHASEWAQIAAQTLHVLSVNYFSREDAKVIIREHGFVILRGALDRKHIATVYDMRNQVTNM